MKYFYCDSCFLITTYQEKYLGSLSQYKVQFFISNTQITEELIRPANLAIEVRKAITIIEDTEDIRIKTIELVNKHCGLSKIDCLSLAFAIVDGYCLVTDDKHLTKIAKCYGVVVKSSIDIINDFNLRKGDK